MALIAASRELENALAAMAADARAVGAQTVLDRIDVVRTLLADGAPAAVLALASIRAVQAAEAARLAAYAQDRLRGQRVLQAAKDGHTAVHGTLTQRQARYAQYQATVDEIHRKNPRLSWTELSNRAGRVHGCAGRTIRRHCRQPQNKPGQTGHCPSQPGVGSQSATED